MRLQISGQTRRDEALLQFIRNLFAHPAFRDPNLVAESQIEGGGTLVRFDATVTYLPGGPPHSAVVEEAPAAGKKVVTTTRKSATSATKKITTAPRAPGGRP